MKLVILAALLVACGTSSTPAGGVCKGSSECATGLTCEELGQFSGSACTPVGKVCTTTCANNTDCSTLGSSFMCFASCGSAMICGATTP